MTKVTVCNYRKRNSMRPKTVTLNLRLQINTIVTTAHLNIHRPGYDAKYGIS